MRAALLASSSLAGILSIALTVIPPKRHGQLITLPSEDQTPRAEGRSTVGAEEPHIEVMILENEVFKNWYEDQFGYCDSKHMEVSRVADPQGNHSLRVIVHGTEISGVDLQFLFAGDGKTTPTCQVSGRWRLDLGPAERDIKPLRGLVTVSKRDILHKNPLRARFAILAEARTRGKAYPQGAFSGKE